MMEGFNSDSETISGITTKSGVILYNNTFILEKNEYVSITIIEYKKRKSYYKAFHKDEEGFLTYFLRRYLAVHKKRSVSP